MPESFKKLSVGDSAHQKEYEDSDEELGWKFRALRIKPFNFNYLIHYRFI